MSNIRHTNDGFVLKDAGLEINVRGGAHTLVLKRRGYEFRHEHGAGGMWETATVPTATGSLSTEESDSGISVIEEIKDRFGNTLASGRRAQYGVATDFSGHVIRSPKYYRDGSRVRLRGDTNYFSCYGMWLHAAEFSLDESSVAEEEPDTPTLRYRALFDGSQYADSVSRIPDSAYYDDLHTSAVRTPRREEQLVYVDDNVPAVRTPRREEQFVCVDEMPITWGNILPSVNPEPRIPQPESQISTADLHTVYNRLTRDRNGN